MQNNLRVITTVFEKDGKLYGKSDVTGGGLNIYNLNRTADSILAYDFRNVVEGRELVKQYIPIGDKDAS